MDLEWRCVDVGSTVNEGTTLMGMLINREAVHVEAESTCEISIQSLQFCYDPKTALKIYNPLKKIRYERGKNTRFSLLSFDNSYLPTHDQFFYIFLYSTMLKKQNPQSPIPCLQSLWKYYIRSKLKPTTKLQINLFGFVLWENDHFKTFVSVTPITPHKTINAYDQMQGQNRTIILHYWWHPPIHLFFKHKLSFKKGRR